MSITIDEKQVSTPGRRRTATALTQAVEGGASLRAALGAFARVAAAAERTVDIDDLLHVVARQMCELVGVGRCSIHLRDERAGLFRGCVCYAGQPVRHEDIKRSRAGVPADGMTAELLRTRAPVIVANAADDARMPNATARFWKIHSIMAVPMIFADEVVGVVFLDNTTRQHVFTTDEAEVAATFSDLAAVAVMHAQSRQELRAQIDAGDRHLKALRRAATVDERLSDLVLEGRSLQDLLGTLAELIGKPCAVFGEDGRRLALGVPPGTQDGIAPRLLERSYANRPEVCEALAQHEGSRAFVVGPLPQAGILHRYGVAPVMVGSERCGRLVVMEHQTRFVGGDMLTLRRAATLVALQVSVERRAVEADWNAGASLAAELLTGSSDPDTVARRAGRLGVALDVPRVVMLVAARDGRPQHPAFRALAASFRRHAPALDVQATAMGNGMAILAEVPPESEAGAFLADCQLALERVCAEAEPAGSLVAGVSTVSTGAEGYRAAHAEVCQVVDCIRRFSPPGGRSVFGADELGAGRLFLATSDADLIAGFAEATVGSLVDDPSVADLLSTLCSFFDNMASIRRCAACLGVHENTIRYRLARIEDLTGLAVTHDPEAQMRARLSLLVLLLQGRLPVVSRPGTH